MNAKVGNEVALCRQGVDAAVHPDYRGKGLHLKTDKIKIEVDLINRAELVYSVSTNPLILKQRVRLKKEEKDLRYDIAVSRLVWFKDVDAFMDSVGGNSLRKSILKYMIIGARTFNRIRSSLSGPSVARSTSIKIRAVEKFDDPTNTFWGEVKKDYKFTVDRTPSYLTWRYLDPNGGTYFVRQAEENGIVVGIIVLSIDDHDPENHRGIIVDLLVPKDRLACAEPLVSDSLAFFEKKGVNTVEYWVTRGHFYGSVFEKFGFIDKKSDIDLLISTQRPQVIETFSGFKPNEILFQIGDTDWI